MRAIGRAAIIAASAWALAILGAPWAAASTPGGGLVPQLASLPQVPGLRTAEKTTSTACTLPDGTNVNYFHCYTPDDIRAAYGVDAVALLNNGHPNYGKDQTIVLVDSYGSPTAKADLQKFHDTFFPSLPNPDFTQVFPQGKPQYKQYAKNCAGAGVSGPCAAASWSGEATLDIEWAYAIAPKAHIILLAVPPAETEGVQGFPNLFNAISAEIKATPRGTVFSMSLAVTEQTFSGMPGPQIARFDAVFKQGLAKQDNFFAATGDNGTANGNKRPVNTPVYPYATALWPATSPYVVAVGGTQLQRGWTWNPTSNTAFTSSGFDPAYWQWTAGGNTQAVWNESWGDIGTGGGASVIYPRPSWQAGVGGGYGDHRLVPDTAWNAAVNGGVDVWITAYPAYNCNNATGCWNVYGGTSAATPQMAALVALVNAARADAGKQPLGFLNEYLYATIGSTDYTDITPQHYGSAPQIFAGTEVGVSGPVNKSVGDLVDNQLWQSPVAGYPTTTGWDATTGWGVPNAAEFVAALVAQ